jgi:hypothetical protein
MKSYLKTGILVLLILAVPAAGFSESDKDELFCVVHVSGTIIVKKGIEEQPLKNQDTLKPDCEISFKTPKAAAVIIGPKSGRRILAPDNLKLKPDGSYIFIPDDSPKKEENEFVNFLKVCFLPSRGSFGTRAMNPEHLKKEMDFLILKLKEFGKNEKEIATEALGFLTDVYYNKADENKAREVLKEDFGINCSLIP